MRRVRPRRIAIRRVAIVGAMVCITESNGKKNEYPIQTKDGKKYYVDNEKKINYI